MNSKNKFALLGFSLIVGLASVQPALSAVTVFADIQTAGKAFDGIYDPVADVTGPFSVRFLANTGGDSLFGFGMLTSFDASAVQAANATYGADWTVVDPKNPLPIVNNTAGSIETLANIGNVADPLSGSAVPLYTVDFSPITALATFSITNSFTPPKFENQFLDGNGNPATVTFSPSEIRVVPVPAAIWLMLSSIAGWAWMRKRLSQS